MPEINRSNKPNSIETAKSENSETVRESERKRQRERENEFAVTMPATFLANSVPKHPEGVTSCEFVLNRGED